MNNLIKAWVIALFGVMSSYATTIIFNGCSNTPNNYFTFTPGADEYCIAKCTPKINPDSETTIKLKIPGAVYDNQVSLGAKAFDWSGYQGNFANLKLVYLIFEKVGNTCVRMPDDCSYIFREYNTLSKITKINMDVSGISTNNVTNMTGMFRNCSKLTSLNLSNFNTSKVTNMAHMFNLCSGITSLNVSSFDTSNVTNMSSMFQQCYGLTALDVSNFDVHNVTSMGHMFYLSKNLRALDLSSFACEKIALDCLVSGCTSLTYLDISNIDARRVKYIANIFQKCTALATLKISEYFSPPTNTQDSLDTMFSSCNANVNIVGTKVNQFIPDNATVKSKINAGANKVYIYQTPSAWISDEFKEIVKEQLGITTFTQEPETTDISKIFTATSSDSLYIAQSKDNKTIVADASNKTISGALVNKTVDGIGYYPANLRLTGSITLSGDNSAFNQKSFLVGDGVKDTIITFTNPNALPKTNTTVESNGAVVFDGAENYILSNNISIKSGGKLNATTRIILAGNGGILKFEN